MAQISLCAEKYRISAKIWNFWNVRIRYECSVKWLQVKNDSNFIKSDVRNLYVTFFHIHQIEFNLTRYQFTQFLTFFMNQTVWSFSDKVTWFSKCHTFKLESMIFDPVKFRGQARDVNVATSTLVMDIGDEMCWHPKDVTNIKISSLTPTNCHHIKSPTSLVTTIHVARECRRQWYSL